MKSFLKLGHWMPQQAWLKKAKADAFQMAGRHDVPTHVAKTDLDGNVIHDQEGNVVMTRIAPDLRDERSRWWGAPGGGRLAGHVSIDDMAGGSRSSVVPLLMGLLTLFAVLGALSLGVAFQVSGNGHPTLSKWLGIGFPVGLILACVANVVLWHAIGRREWIKTNLLAAAVPFIGTLATFALTKSPLLGETAGIVLSGSNEHGTGAVSVGIAAMLGWVISAIAFGVVALFLVIWMFTGNRDTARSTLVNAAKVISELAVILAFVAIVLPNFMQPLAWIIFGAAHPWRWSRHQDRKRAFQLALMANEYGGDDGRLGNTDPKERRKQAEAVEGDKSGFIPSGTAMGVFTKYGDGLAPDAGLPVGQSPQDLSTHKLVVGETGSGKTFNEMIKTALEWIIARAGGVLALDGKGTLPWELLAKYLGLPRVLLIQPGIRLGLLEGLPPEDVVIAISDVAGAGAKKQEKDADVTEFFNTSGKTALLSINLILKAMVEHEKASGISDRRYLWDLENIDIARTILQEKSEDGDAVLDVVRTIVDTSALPIDLGEGDGKDRMTMLRRAANYIELKLWTMPNETRSGVLNTIDTWLTPLMEHPDLHAWASQETGVDPTICLRGGYVGMSLPDFIYGEAGKLAQNLVRHRVMAGIRRRQKKGWREEGQTPVLILMDEAQELIGEEDVRFLGVARSHGGACCYATQSVDAFESRMGDASTRALLANFLSKVVLLSTDRTYHWMEKSLPTGEYIKWKDTGGKVLGFEKSLQKLGGHVLFDDNHELAPYMREFRRKGGGRLVVPARRRSLLSQSKVDHGLDSYYDMDMLEDINMLNVSVVEGGEREVRPLLTHLDCGRYLKKQTAVVSLRRGGVPRRDFIEYAEMSEAELEARDELVRVAILVNDCLDQVEATLKDAAAEAGEDKLGKQALHDLTRAFLALLLDDASIANLEGKDLLTRLRSVEGVDASVEAWKDEEAMRARVAAWWEHQLEPVTEVA